MKSDLEKYFSQFKQNTIGDDCYFDTVFGQKKMLYADWIASGRLYRPIEERMLEYYAPMLGNTHSEASETGITMTKSYNYAREIIKKHVNASEDDILITAGSGMTRVVNKFQRILGLKLPDENSFFKRLTGINLCTSILSEENTPVVFVTHTEHHSNHISWLETISDVVILPPCNDLTLCPSILAEELKKYSKRKIIIGAFSGGSNVTGCLPPVREYAEILHKHNGYCFVDYAASAPYVDIDMHPVEYPNGYFDAIFFSPHKFLGGPGSAGVLVFNKKLYQNNVPDVPGGGTVEWTNRWNERKYKENPEEREDGGTPAFLQTIRTALAIKLKEKMGVTNIIAREKELIEIAFSELNKIKSLHILGDNIVDRIGVITFYSEKINHNLIVKVLNDKYGIQVRGGCSCAGPYGHFLLNINKIKSKHFSDIIDTGDAREKPGWVRISLHPTMTNDELIFVTDAIKEIIENSEKWEQTYKQDVKSGEWFSQNEVFDNNKIIEIFEM